MTVSTNFAGIVHADLWISCRKPDKEVPLSSLEMPPSLAQVVRLALDGVSSRTKRPPYSIRSLIDWQLLRTCKFKQCDISKCVK